MKVLPLLLVLLPIWTLAADPPAGNWAGLVVNEAKSGSHYVHVALAGDHGTAEYDRGTCHSALDFQPATGSYEERIEPSATGRPNFQSGPFQPMPCLGGSVALSLEDHILRYEATKDGTFFRGNLFATDCAGTVGPCLKPGAFNLMTIVGSQVVDDIEKPVYADLVVRKVFLASLKDRESGVWSDFLYVTITHPGEFYYLAQGKDDLGRPVEARSTRRMTVHPMSPVASCDALPRQTHCGHSEEDYILPLASGASSVHFTLAASPEPLEFRLGEDQISAHARRIAEQSTVPRPQISTITSVTTARNPPFSLGVTVLEAAKGPVDHGLAVTSMTADGRAAQAGLQPGDVIALFNGIPLKSDADLREAEKQTHPGLTVFLKIWRPAANGWKDLRLEAK